MLTERHKGLIPEADSRDVVRWGGLTRMSVEASVMEVEQRGEVSICVLFDQLN